MAKSPRSIDSQLHFHAVGHGRPMLFLHGYTADHRLMKGCFEPLFRGRRGWRRIYVDLPGMGRSPSTGVRNADQMVAKLLELIAEVIPTGGFSIAGESYGGYLAQG